MKRFRLWLRDLGYCFIEWVLHWIWLFRQVGLAVWIGLIITTLFIWLLMDRGLLSSPLNGGGG